jgi:hypothetical protein
MSTHYGGRIYRNVAEITGPSGFYNVKTSLGTVVVYVNQSYDGGGWVLVLANRSGTGGMNNLSYYNAVNKSTYRTSSTVTSAPRGIGLADFNCWVGTKYWQELAGRVTSGKITVVQYVVGTNGVGLHESHTKRYRWNFNFSNQTDSYGTSSYTMTNVTGVSDETSTGSPGFFNYHAANGYPLTTSDNYGHWNGCATYYNNNPWWYGGCWSGNYFAGGGYADAPYWDSSGGDYHQYGAVYIK